jgi:hypothetical protein
MSEWEHIIKGEAVDLDKVLSSLHRVSVDSERKASVGDTEISISGVETKRKVETSSEWATSWRSASRAIAFVFEHREQELAEYGDYVERLFAAKCSSSHGQVILFDRGVRNEAGGGQSLLLTDYQYFTSLYAATLQDDGVEYHRNRQGGGNKPSGPRTEVCLQFNSQAECRFSESACKYNTLACPATCPVMARHPVKKEIEGEALGLRPKYLRHNLWTPDSDPKLTIALWTHTALPLPRPPQEEFDNLLVRQTIKERPDLFKIVTPIHIPALERLTSSHPNRPFIDSVLEGLKNGFWPWASTIREGYPIIHDESKPSSYLLRRRHFCWNKFVMNKVSTECLCLSERISYPGCTACCTILY